MAPNCCGDLLEPLSVIWHTAGDCFHSTFTGLVGLYGLGSAVALWPIFTAQSSTKILRTVCLGHAFCGALIFW